MTSVVPRLVTRALRASGTPPLRTYAALLTDTCDRFPPPFGQAWYGDRFRILAMEPLWLLQTLALCSETEGQGAGVLWELAGSIPDADVAIEVRRHAVDESRHSRMFLGLAQTAFPDGLAPEHRRHLRRLAPRYRLNDRPPRKKPIDDVKLLDTIIQMNFGEIRTRINQLLLRPVLTAYAPPEGRRRLTRLLEALLRDETRHITYTARLIELGVTSHGERTVRRLMRRRLREFNAMTRQEVGKATYD